MRRGTQGWGTGRKAGFPESTPWKETRTKQCGAYMCIGYPEEKKNAHESDPYPGHNGSALRVS